MLPTTLEDITRWNDNYFDLMVDCPLDTESVWDIQFEIRNIIAEKGYDLINFCNYPLFIQGQYIGHYNAIEGHAEMIKLLFLQLRNWGYECFYRNNEETPSVSYIVFPKNLTYEIKKDLDKLKDKKEFEKGIRK